MRLSQRWAIVLVNFFSLSWGSEPRLTTLFPELLVDPVPIRLEALPIPEMRVDMLEWRAGSVRYRFEVPRSPQAHTRRGFLCYTLMLERGLSHLPLFEWRAAGEQTPLTAPVNPRGVAVLFVGDLVGGYEFLRQMEYLPLQVRTYPALSIEASTFPLTPVYMRPEQLPDNPVALLGIPFIVLVDGAERLNEAQQRALVLWLHAGGQLIVPIRASASLLRRTRLAPYLPDWDALRMQPLTQRVHLSNARISPPSVPVPVAWLRHPRGTKLAQVGQRTLALQIPWGYGTLSVFGGDLMHPAWRNWEGQATLWKALLNRPRFPMVTLAQLTRPPEPESTQVKRRIAAVPWLGAILAAYWAAFYTLWRVLRAQRRLIYAPYGVTLLSGLSLVAIYFAVPPEPRGTSLSGARLILGVGEHALEYAEYSYRAPSGDWRLRWRPTDALAVAPVAALNPVQVEFTSEGAMIQGNSWIPTPLILYTLTQVPAPMRVERTPTGYRLRNISENLAFGHVYIYRYQDLRPLAEDKPADNKWVRDLEDFFFRLAPGDTVELPYEPSRSYVVCANTQVTINSSTEEVVELWLFYP